jgi:hypothetical protein
VTNLTVDGTLETGKTRMLGDDLTVTYDETGKVEGNLEILTTTGVYVKVDGKVIDFGTIDGVASMTGTEVGRIEVGISEIGTEVGTIVVIAG